MYFKMVIRRSYLLVFENIFSPCIFSDRVQSFRLSIRGFQQLLTYLGGNRTFFIKVFNGQCESFVVFRWSLSRQSFGPTFCVVWPRKMPASGCGSLWESSSFVPWFSTFVFRNVPGTFPERFRNASLSVGSREIRLI